MATQSNICRGTSCWFATWRKPPPSFAPCRLYPRQSSLTRRGGGQMKQFLQLRGRALSATGRSCHGQRRPQAAALRAGATAGLSRESQGSWSQSYGSMGAKETMLLTRILGRVRGSQRPEQMNQDADRSRNKGGSVTERALQKALQVGCPHQAPG